MDIEQQQAEVIYKFVKKAGNLEGSPLATLLTEATSHPSLFAFSEILCVPSLSTLEGTQYSSTLDLLRLFAYGTWTDYKNNASSLPNLLPEQIRKLKQLSVLTLAENNKVLSYNQLMHELDVSNVRELEDFLINECMYSGYRGTIMAYGKTGTGKKFTLGKLALYGNSSRSFLCCE